MYIMLCWNNSDQLSPKASMFTRVWVIENISSILVINWPFLEETKEICAGQFYVSLTLARVTAENGASFEKMPP